MNLINQTESSVQSQNEATPNNPRIMGLVAEVERNISSVEAQVVDRPQDLLRVPLSTSVNINNETPEIAIVPSSQAVFATVYQLGAEIVNNRSKAA